MNTPTEVKDDTHDYYWELKKAKEQYQQYVELNELFDSIKREEEEPKSDKEQKHYPLTIRSLLLIELNPPKI